MSSHFSFEDDDDIGSDGRALPVEAGGLLECVGQLEHPEIVLVAAHDLNADGQAFGRKAARHGNSGEPHGGNEVTGLHGA